MTKETNTKKRTICLIIAAVLFIVGTLTVYVVDRNFGNVEIRRIVYSDIVSGEEYNALLYVPKTANVDNPAPAVISQHGGSQNLSQMHAYNIELSRRGYVVLTYDNYGAGLSSQGDNSNRADAGDSAIAMLQTLKYVQGDQIVAIGHSMGGSASFTEATRHPDAVRLCVAIGMNTRDDSLDTNYAYILGKNDASALVRTDGHVRDIVDVDSYRTLFGTTEDIVIGQEYGNWEEGTGRIYLVSNTMHTWEPFDTLTINYVLDVISRVIPNPNPIDPSSQIWYVVTIGMGMVLASVLMSIFLIASYLLSTKYFGKLVVSVRKPVGFEKKTLPWVISFAILIVTPALLYGLLSSVMETHSWDWMKMNSTVDGIVHWHWAIAVIYAVLFVIFHFIHGKKAGGNLMTYGLSTEDDENRVSLRYVFRAVLFSCLVIGGAYLVYSLYHAVTGESIAFTKWTMNSISREKSSFFLVYVVIEIPYLVMVGLLNRSISVNNGYRQDGKGMKNSIIASLLVNASGLAVSCIIFYIIVSSTGFVPFTTDRGYIFYTGLFGTLLYIAMCGLVNCYITNRTNSIYAGTIAAALLSAWSLVGNFPMG